MGRFGFILVAASLLGSLGFDAPSEMPSFDTSNDVDAQLAIVENPAKSIKVRAAAARELGALGLPSVVPRLLAMLPRQEDDLTAGIIRALGELKDPRAIPRLKEMYEYSENGPLRALMRWSIRQCDEREEKNLQP
jgi:HEAT repeat protein